MTFTIGVFVTIFNEDQQVLLCHRRDFDAWNLPGGGMESGELPVETAIRETKEETGLEIVVQKLIGVYGKTYKDELVFVFSGKIVGGEISMTARERPYPGKNEPGSEGKCLQLA